ncbi:MAG TPA: DUF1328 domain-containing protein [Pseudobdellovibrionaceae bacterium]|nr:DUF1328 domain-containing protein [Pseudobdellovibrionaceae bacterium]
MLRAAVAFFVIAVLAFIFGAYGIAGLSVDIGRMLLIVFLVLSVISFLVSMITGGKLNNR